jgi:SAM-dependent methyltransferase
MSARGLRSRVGDALRRMHLLGAADRVLRYLAMAVEGRANRGFQRTHPTFPVPPSALCFETLGHVSASEYLASGERHARLVTDLAREANVPADPDVLEWGCGCARILRHLRAAGIGQGRLAGCDVDPQLVAWCRDALPALDVRCNGAEPPLPFEDATFDLVYHYSVLTHLTQEHARRWVDDIARVLRDGGVMIGTTHGERYADMLLPEERARIERGEVVARAGNAEGRKRFLAFHPAATMKAMLQLRFREVRLVLALPGIPQDVWIARLPIR